MGKQFGPWHVKNDGELYHVVTNGGRNADCIVSTRRKDHAKLISAAPDLLQLCERALALLSNPDADQFMADALEVELQIGINKARGK